jgi:hypothetical protein
VNTYQRNIETLRKCQLAHDHMSPPEIGEDEEVCEDDGWEPDYEWMD